MGALAPALSAVMTRDSGVIYKEDCPMSDERAAEAEQENVDPVQAALDKRMGRTAKESRELMKARLARLGIELREPTNGIVTEYDAIQTRRGPARSAKVNRNAPCPCGSGKKAKLCCPGRGSEERAV